jgi:O-antigen/teichoic acid export membrane protein
VREGAGRRASTECDGGDGAGTSAAGWTVPDARWRPGPARVSSPTSSAAASQIRGSSLLTVGRVLSLGVNFLVQVLIARHLSTTQFGAWAYALSLVTLGETITTFGLDRGASRFLALYDERRDYRRLTGTLLLVAGTILSIGLSLVLLVVGLRGWLSGHVIGDVETVSLLAILITLSPLQAADNLLSGVLATFASAKSIFIRRYVLTPGFRLAVVLLLVLGHQQVRFLAWGYVLSGVVGISLYCVILWQVLGRRGVRQHLRIRNAQIPFKEILGFTVPLLSTDLVYVSMTTTDALLLQHYFGTPEVAALRVIGPLANLNLIIYSSFTLLFTPVAARLLARGDSAGVADLYWRTASWVAVFSFPMFALTATMAKPVTIALYQERYAGSAVFLTLLATGQYFNAALGFNGLTLRVFGLLRYTMVINLVAVVANVALNLVLTPRLGALGAAIATATTLLLHNVLKQLGLRRTGISVFDWRYAKVYVVIGVVAGALGASALLFDPDVWVSIALAAVGSLVVLLVNRDRLAMHETFPEVMRIPIIKHLFRGPG